MSRLVPSVGRSVESVFRKAGIAYEWIDRDGGVCCGRPMYLAGRLEEAEAIVRKNEAQILGYGVGTLVVSCPICYKMFKEKYDLPGIRIVHYIDYMQELLDAGRLKASRSDLCYVYHDPCEIPRGGFWNWYCRMGEAGKRRRSMGKCAGACGLSKTSEQGNRYRCSKGRWL